MHLGWSGLVRVVDIEALDTFVKNAVLSDLNHQGIEPEFIDDDLISALMPQYIQGLLIANQQTLEETRSRVKGGLTPAGRMAHKRLEPKFEQRISDLQALAAKYR